MKNIFYLPVLFVVSMALFASSSHAQTEELPKPTCLKFSGLPELKEAKLIDPGDKQGIKPGAKAQGSRLKRIGVKINTVKFDIGDDRPYRQNASGNGKEASCLAVSLMLRF